MTSPLIFLHIIRSLVVFSTTSSACLFSEKLTAYCHPRYLTSESCLISTICLHGSSWSWISSWWCINIGLLGLHFIPMTSTLFFYISSEAFLVFPTTFSACLKQKYLLADVTHWRRQDFFIVKCKCTASAADIGLKFLLFKAKYRRKNPAGEIF